MSPLKQMSDEPGRRPASSDEIEPSEAIEVYRRFQRVFGEGGSSYQAVKRVPRQERGATVPFGAGRDPDTLGDVLGGLTRSMGWTTPLAQSELVAAWRDIAGADTAEHSTPVSIEEGTLTVQCDSTAWATQLRIMRVEITTRIANGYPEAGVQSIRFLGPNAPSWKRGPRSVPGRGPRDTYG